MKGSKFISINQSAQLLDLSTHAIYKLVGQGQLDEFHAGTTNRPRILNNQKLQTLLLEIKVEKQKERDTENQFQLFRKQYMKCVERTEAIFQSSSSS